MQTANILNSYCQMKLFVMINQIVGSAPGFPHGIIDPIEVSFFI